jgi:hypothetical protein
MSFECELKRYAAYFRGWCQAFGEIDKEFEEADGITWLLAEDQVGLILPDHLRREVYRQVLGTKAKAKVLTVSDSHFQLGETAFDIASSKVREYLKTLLQSFTDKRVLHLYLTYHLTYPSGTRCVTISMKSPLRIIYKEIDPMSIRIE